MGLGISVYDCQVAFLNKVLSHSLYSRNGLSVIRFIKDNE